jgi:hypothetical protein
MPTNQSILSRALQSGTVAALTSSVTASLAGRYENASYAAPLNATSHILWGDKAAQEDKPSFKYTATGFLLNHAAAFFWAAVYEKWFASRSDRGEQSALTPVIGAAVVTAGAYITDYYLVPKRLTPGFEKRLSGRSMAMIYGALAVGLAASTLIGRRA